MPVRGVIFDMGGTLLHYTPPGETWERTEILGAASVYRVLREHHYSLLPEDEALPLAWDHARAVWSSVIRNYDPKVLKLGHQLNLLAARWGAPNLPDEVARLLPSAYMTAIQAQVRPLDGAVETLRTLRDQDLRLGLISNTVWPGSVHIDDLTRHGLSPYLEFLTFSADVDAWKPYSDVFEMGLEALDLAPDEAVYVGDSLYFDVFGAQQAGLRGVWIEQPVRWLPDGVEVIPDATIRTLPDLLDVLARVELMVTASLPKRRIPIWVLLLLFAVILVVGGIVVYLLMPLNGPIPDGVETHYAGLEQGATKEGFPRLGSAAAPVLVEDFSSYACPHCRTFHEEQFEDLLPAIAAEEVQFVFIPIPMVGPGARTAAAGALCAGEQGQFWEMHDTLYDWQRQFVASIFHERRVKNGAKNLGLDTGAFDACMGSDRIAAILDRAEQEFKRRGLTGTPSLFINGERVHDYDEFENLGGLESTGV